MNILQIPVVNVAARGKAAASRLGELKAHRHLKSLGCHWPGHCCCQWHCLVLLLLLHAAAAAVLQVAVHQALIGPKGQWVSCLGACQKPCLQLLHPQLVPSQQLLPSAAALAQTEAPAAAAAAAVVELAMALVPVWVAF
jgi:hypothetical protein